MASVHSNSYESQKTGSIAETYAYSPYSAQAYPAAVYHSAPEVVELAPRPSTLPEVYDPAYHQPLPPRPKHASAYHGSLRHFESPIWGVPRRLFLMLAVFAILALAVALGVGLGVGLSSSNSDSNSTPTSPTNTAKTTATTTITSAVGATPTTTGVTSGTTGIAGSTCVTPQERTYESSIQDKRFRIECYTDWPGGDPVRDSDDDEATISDIASQWIYSLEDCLDSCASWNQNRDPEGDDYCYAAVYNWNLTEVTELGHGGNCYFKNGPGVSWGLALTRAAAALVV